MNVTASILLGIVILSITNHAGARGTRTQPALHHSHATSVVQPTYVPSPYYPRSDRPAIAACNSGTFTHRRGSDRIMQSTRGSTSSKISPLSCRFPAHLGLQGAKALRTRQRLRLVPWLRRVRLHVPLQPLLRNVYRRVRGTGSELLCESMRRGRQLWHSLARWRRRRIRGRLLQPRNFAGSHSTAVHPREWSSKLWSSRRKPSGRPAGRPTGHHGITTGS